MERITLENFETTYVDPIEEERIDKFVCDEMGRQIHRYIKGMSGSKDIMNKFEAQLSTLSIPEKGSGYCQIYRPEQEGYKRTRLQKSC